MEFLIVFETVEGQTRKISEFVAEHLRTLDHGVRMFDTQDRLASVSFDDIDKIVLAGSVHERRHPHGFEVFVSTSRDELKLRETLLISVSLKAAFPEGLEEAQDYLTEMEMRTGFKPDKEALVAGAVRTNSYGYFESQIIRNVVLGDRDIDLVDGVCEFTDWDKLRGEIDAFLQPPASS